jgi:TM2 domain-containing membrane protein YozV
MTNEAKTFVTAFLFWWFLGVFGGHRFYLHRPHAKTMLILALIVVGLPVTAVWALVDVFSLQKWVEEHNSRTIEGC